MNITLTSLEALILKATHESLPCPDAAALEAFCSIMRDAPEGPMMAAQALAGRMHSPNAREALLALTMVDRCMRRCDASFHSEVGKFRFLNEMIKLVSPKYFADRTAIEVRTMVLQLLHAWSIEYPKENKFKVAYDMLKNQGVVKETPPPLPPEEAPPPPRVKSVIFEDEEKSKLLQKLLQSKKPEDLQHANRLIKSMVREEERRNEANSRRAADVTAALDSAGLLSDMLSRASQASPDERALIHELRLRCACLKPSLDKLAATDAGDGDLSDILHASDVLNEVFEKYNAFAINETREDSRKQVQSPPETANSLLDFAGAINVEEPKAGNVIDELGDIFASDGAGAIAAPLTPVSLMPAEDVDLIGDSKANKVEGWNELDSLGEQLMKKSLPNNARRLDHFNSKSTKKVPMNALENSPKRETQNGVLFDLDFFTKKPEENKEPENTVQPTPDDIMVDISTNGAVAMNSSPIENILDIGTHLDPKCDKKIDVKTLTDINLTLESVTPSELTPIKAFKEDDGVTVVLHFCKDKPRPDVYVVVISTTSKSKSPIGDFRFQGVVPKGSKVRLLPASGGSLPSCNPFLPPPALTQLMLIATNNTPITLKFVITYTREEEMCSEIGEVSLPLHEI